VCGIGGLGAFPTSPHQGPLRQFSTEFGTPPNIVARILKNDFGQGGAWDFYWGAFYPKGGSRVEDAQLYLWINQDRLKCGFYIGKHGSVQRERFLRNCREHGPILKELLKETLSGGRLLFGDGFDWIDLSSISYKSPQPTWTEWLDSPDSFGINISHIMPAGEALDLDGQDLASRVAKVHVDLFPLALLCVSDTPLPAIQAYLKQPTPPPPPKLYTLGQFAEDTGYPADELARWVRALHRKGQAILSGPPGTGKTFVAERMARHLTEGSDGFVQIIQFHPSYAYEDFIQGIRPQSATGGGLAYPIVPGVFLEFCRKAKDRKGLCVLIIDEINRGNLSRIFGELMYLLEYRGREVPLASGGILSIPANVRIIGTMNTADRSIALVDHALRRRFAFIGLYPNYEVLRKYHALTEFSSEPLVEVLTQLNREIGDRHYEVGISFFLREGLSDHIEDIWRMEIEPYLEEYFFDQYDKVALFRWENVGKRLLS
jgi:5-methylcytosine-specific restriction enzyme B